MAKRRVQLLIIEHTDYSSSRDNCFIIPLYNVHQSKAHQSKAHQSNRLIINLTEKIEVIRYLLRLF
ncbi:hypothetical protein A3Q33_11355 [Colwellia sp. PAMC 21821]|nr:hypothetical protein A3Q33_11355 [Colwellia sp. PAMC 21821]